MTSACRPALGGIGERPAVGLAEEPMRGVPVAEPQRRVVQGVGDRVAPARGRRAPRELAEQPAEGGGREQLGPRQGDGEADREHDSQTP